MMKMFCYYRFLLYLFFYHCFVEVCDGRLLDTLLVSYLWMEGRMDDLMDGWMDGWIGSASR